MKNATFYLLDNDTHQDGLSAVEQLVCELPQNVGAQANAF
jgi:DNA polymerase-3 subunit chi